MCYNCSSPNSDYGRVQEGGFRRAGTNEQTKAMQRQKLKDSLGLTNDQARKVDAIQQDFSLKMRAIKLDTRIADKDKKSKLLALENEKVAKLKEVISDQQIAKMEGQKLPAKKTPYHKKKSRTRQKV